MNKELQEKLMYSFPHGLRFDAICPEFGTHYEGLLLTSIKSINKQYPYWAETANDYFNKDANYGVLAKENLVGRGFDKIMPHYRPLSSLTKPIVVQGYNNNEPFVPMQHLVIGYGNSIDEHGCLWVGMERSDYTSLPFSQVEPLFRWHFWIGDQALFQTGEIIAIKD